MKVAFVQYDIQWENAQENFNKIEQILASSSDPFELLILPEMFNTGFSMDTHKNAELMSGKTLDWMKSIAREYNAVVTGSLIIQEGEVFYNRLLWVEPNGNIDHYDKKHLFTLAKENNFFEPGKERKIFKLQSETETWKICPLICYDLRFPVWSRNTEDYDLLIYVANFPEKRKYAWSQLLISRAIENQSYTIGVNRIGLDGININYSGDSVALNYEGKKLVDCHSEEGIFYVNLSKEKQVAYRRAYNFLRDRDLFSIV
ncbi:nitrilase family protein [Portibacter lacus]|uniref:Omega-amidase YafV n=1 Tax=Portibacter lacus TaxID=1099794 RepID=A0AA37WD95_9BACT|nr:nitrilase family protein [Portibacter lacus]GLR16603.1 nitrilase family protein [Portibacter lacus]